MVDEKTLYLREFITYFFTNVLIKYNSFNKTVIFNFVYKKDNHIEQKVVLLVYWSLFLGGLNGMVTAIGMFKEKDHSSTEGHLRKGITHNSN